MEQLTELRKGVLEGCVLEILSRQETYGYEITRRLNQLGFDDVVEGTVYTILLRLERQGLVEAEKRPPLVGPPRKCYRLNRAGWEKRKQFWDRWAELTAALSRLKETPWECGTPS